MNEMTLIPLLSDLQATYFTTNTGQGAIWIIRSARLPIILS